MKLTGIIGCGRIIEDCHVPAFRKLAQRVRVTAIADPVPQRLKFIGDKLRVPKKSRYTDYREMLEKEKLDFVDIAVPHFLHEDTIIQAAKHGVNVLTEKPLTTTMASAKRIIDAVKKSGIHFGIIHNYRYEPFRQKASKLIHDGKLGKPFFIRFEYHGWAQYAGAAGYRPYWRSESKYSGGGAVIDNAYHYAYLAEEFMCSPVVEVYAKMGTFVKKQDVEDLGVMTLMHANGGISSLQFSWGIHAGGRSVTEVHGTKGSLWFGYDGVPLQFFDNAHQRWTKYRIKGDFITGFTNVFKEYLDSLVGKARYHAGPALALRTIAIVMAAYKSAKEGRVVRVAEME
jgi:UDP-N-acetyl-2-amino-2-deoxyglucuronate dehydrogenase